MDDYIALRLSNGEPPVQLRRGHGERSKTPASSVAPR